MKMRRVGRVRSILYGAAIVPAVVLPSAAQVPDSLPAFIRIVRVKPASSWEAYRSSIMPGPAALRGFRFALLDRPEDRWPVAPPGASSAERLRQAADIVSQRLSTDGLLPTLLQVIRQLGPSYFDSNPRMDVLRTVGLPVDWLDYFTLPGGASGGDAIVRAIARKLAAAENEQAIGEFLATGRFQFHASLPGFRLATETGDRPIERVRMQLPSTAYWRGPGDGSAIDLVRQMVAAWPDRAITLSIEEKNVPAFLAAARDWPLHQKDQLTLLIVPWPIEQWTQDNGKPGHAAGAAGHAVPALLLPRYANRGEERTLLDADESLTVRALSEAGLQLVSSPLLFQGGNLLPVRDPATGKRTLLIGEAEVYRNTALGLRREQVLDAFKIECGVDRCRVLPAVSFHLDFELTARSHNGQLLAFVNDEKAAARIILTQGVGALVRMGSLGAAAAQSARASLAAGKDRETVQLLSGPSNGLARRDGVFPAETANHFSTGSTDSGAANLQRFMLSLDILASHAATADDLPPDALTRAYVLSLKRRDADRLVLRHALEELGWRVVPVPSLADEDRSINYLNGFQEPGRYVMPAWGGFYTPLDLAAANAFRQAMGSPNEVLPIFASESQRRLGAIHCSASIWPESDR